MPKISEKEILYFSEEEDKKPHKLKDNFYISNGIYKSSKKRSKLNKYGEDFNDS